ncbi:hypothetical protein M9H77_23767 [Catharanthus roseus]|uniref:Uncharacterized protein n=1 Tax=Catharanthus roseus TaxID=4058 RepID=A0ACC0AV77_CATRO|nr:hypothetical protein M9H77_23767 [Catharanthus roseus]
MKSRPRLIDVPHQDDVFQENIDIHEGSTIDVTIEDVGPLTYEACSLKELRITIERYFEEIQNDEIEIEWDFDEDFDKENNYDSNAESDNDSDEDSDKTLCD